MKQSGCGSTSSITENSNLSDQLYIYPNPSRGVIHFGSLNDASWNEYLLINSLGKVIQKGKFISGSLIVSVELPATGIYLLMVKDGRGKERSKKIVRL
ncbi:MAG: T9SS type A sorting domain-containing protein [Bacteroidia bacterium]|nr:T9SS type A sorting domain-containing protein [Bacteroidia bacterium]